MTAKYALKNALLCRVRLVFFFKLLKNKTPLKTNINCCRTVAELVLKEKTELAMFESDKKIENRYGGDTVAYLTDMIKQGEANVIAEAKSKKPLFILFVRKFIQKSKENMPIDMVFFTAVAYAKRIKKERNLLK